MKKAPKLPEPIVLSGRVYLDGFLAEEAGFALALRLLVGDIKLHKVNKGGSRERFGQTYKYEGFFAAGIWDGKRWRRLLLRRKAAVDATFVGLVEMRSKARACVLQLRTLAAKKAVWVADDSGFEVTWQDNPAPQAQPQTPVQAVKPVVTAQTVPVGQSPASQLDLFPDLPATPTKSRRARNGASKKKG